MKHVIIGNGPAGVIAAEVLGRENPDAKVVLIGDEPLPPYSRMAIPYLLQGDIDEAGTYLRKDPEHFARLGIELLTARVEKVDTVARKLALDSGASLPYDRLLIASGSRPVAPPVPGVDLPGVLPCWTLEHARGIAQCLKPGARVLQMGAGFIGCIIMQALASRGARLTVVEMGGRMVPRMMTEGAGALIRSWCESKGVRVLTATRVQAIEAAGDALRAHLSNGETLDADLVISATGVKPIIDFLDGSGIKTGVGVLVDEAMQTSVAGVYAAGDVAEVRDFSSGEPVLYAIQPNAADQARVAALNMAGEPARYQGALAMNVLDTLGLIAVSFGRWMGVPGGEHAELADPQRYRYLRLEFEDDVLIGATALGLTRHVGVLRGLIQSRTRLGPWKARLLQDPARVMEAYLARTQAAA